MNVELNKKNNGLPKIRNILVLVLFFYIIPLPIFGQQVVQNPLEYVAIAEGNDAINSEVKESTQKQLETAALQNMIAGEFNKIHEWESKYSSYLQQANGFASSLKAASQISIDGARLLLTLGQLKDAIVDNPQGLPATIAMNDIYLETAAELVTTFTLIQSAVDKGGKENMLNGAERSQILWALSDKISSLQKSLHRLYRCIRYYEIVDVWNTYTTGLFDLPKSTIAKSALDRWKRAGKVLK